MNKFPDKLKFILPAAVIYRVYSHLFKQCEYFKLNLLQSEGSCILFPSLVLSSHAQNRTSIGI